MTETTLDPPRVREAMEASSDSLTPSERQLRSVILADYPFAALGPIQELADRANVSAPSISRFVSKLGYRGFQEFQQSLLSELKDSQSSPIELRRTPAGPASHRLTDYVTRAMALTRDLAVRMPPDQFDRICTMLGDPKRRVFMLGGRMSDAIAEFFLRHLRQIRSDVFHVPPDPEAWPEYLLRMKPRDVVVLFDFRRYDAKLAEFAAAGRVRKAQTIIITDPWITPAAKGATELVTVPIDSGTLWDSYVPAFALVEALLVPLAERDWDATRTRIEAWDTLRGRTPGEARP
ncbi:MurR/RpiR family transcriptional regulator [Ovoidimarina sediminis]|uniref:MurR/RpiR family transcriptional regulator n=1 Tax=Ovoidimarina sediminis TaxID=3079856 RepID=UPI0029076203|nr:MurR/RpiR family transcriptional regulator [Rhodophyticola sp. MJ-SS7]MDU8944182.1 MurR/RpiR family transcriptional regulator [Rhodophyticola sp. MJ-SS7]